MLKKAGIVTAIAAACALSVSPLAFAGDYKSDNGGDDSDKGHHKKHKKHDDADCDQDNSIDNKVDNGDGATNFLDIQNNTLQINPQVCGNQVLSGVGVAALIAKATGTAENGD